MVAFGDVSNNSVGINEESRRQGRNVRVWRWQVVPDWPHSTGEALALCLEIQARIQADLPPTYVAPSIDIDQNSAVSSYSVLFGAIQADEETPALALARVAALSLWERGET